MLSSVGGVLGRAVTFRRQLVRKNGGLKNENLQNQLSNLLFQCSIPGVGCRVDARGYISPQTKRSRSRSVGVQVL
jgi:hypothetical protein